MTANTGVDGGALALEFATMDKSKRYVAHFIATQFSGSLATSAWGYGNPGGAVHIMQQDTNASYVPVVTLDNCVWSENRGIGLVLENLGNLYITECRFLDNGLIPIGELLALLSSEAATRMGALYLL